MLIIGPGLAFLEMGVKTALHCQTLQSLYHSTHWSSNIELQEREDKHSSDWRENCGIFKTGLKFPCNDSCLPKVQELVWQIDSAD